MPKIVISVNKLEMELFTELCRVRNCFIEKKMEANNNNLLVTIYSFHSVNFYQLGFEFGAYAPTFIPS